MSDAINHIATDTLAQLMDLGTDATPDWTPQELAAMLTHQLSAPLAFDLCALKEVSVEKVNAVAAAHTPAVESFGDLLTHAHPSVELLELVKEFAKTSDSNQNRLLPRPIASVLYYASIVAAQLRCDTRLTTLSDKLIGQGLRWSLSQDWLNDDLRSLLDQGCAFLKQDPAC